MKYLRLLVLLIRKGSLSQTPFNFEADRQQTVDVSHLPVSTSEKKIPVWKAYLLRSPWGYTVLSNLAYLKNAPRMNKMYYVSDDHRLVYVRILKSASTSVLKEFLPLIEPKLRNEKFTDSQLDTLAYYHAKKDLTPQQQRYTKFAVVRDPFRRIVSVYFDLFDTRAPVFTYATYWFGVLQQDMTFKDFVKTIAKIPTSLSGPHFVPQVSILKDVDEIRNISILKIEEPEGIDEFFTKQGMSMPHVNKQSSYYDYRSYYDPETLALVYRMYRDDVNLLGYKGRYEALRHFISIAYAKRTV